MTWHDMTWLIDWVDILLIRLTCLIGMRWARSRRGASLSTAVLTSAAAARCTLPPSLRRFLDLEFLEGYTVVFVSIFDMLVKFVTAVLPLCASTLDSILMWGFSNTRKGTFFRRWIFSAHHDFTWWWNRGTIIVPPSSSTLSAKLRTHCTCLKE